MASQEKILEQLSEPKTYADLTEDLGQKGGALTKPLKALKDKGLIEMVDGQYRLKDEVVEPEKPPVEKPAGETPALPSDYSEFSKIGESIGVSGDFLKSICDYVFRGNPYSIETVHGALRGLHLRPDTIARWVSMWAAAIGKPAPKEAEATAATTTTPAPRRFSVVGENVVVDPEGELSFYQALSLLETKLAKQAQPQGQSSELVNLLIARMDKQDSRFEAMMERISDERFAQLAGAIQSVDKKVESRQEASRMGIIDHGLSGILSEAKSLRTDLKPIIEGSIANMQARQHPPRDKTGFSQGLSLGIEKERRLREMEDKLFLGKTEPVHTKVSFKPPPQPPRVFE